MLELQQVNSTSHPSPFSERLEFDRDLKFSCNPEESLSNSEKLLSDFENLLTGLPTQGHAAVSETIEDRLTQLQTPFSYPSTFEYAELAQRVYAEQNQGGELKDRPLRNGWSLLTTAYNDDVLTSYFGAAYWNSTKRQVVIAHRGTVFKAKKEIIGTLRADIEGIFQNQHTPQINSAVTFAYEVSAVLRQINKNNPGLNIQLSFTGHSLGGWLAQITTYTTKYLEKVGNNFLKDSQKNGLHARTVVFDSPGCQETLSSLQDELEPRGMKSDYERDLDITVYLSGPNLINTCNLHIGTRYRIFIDLSKEENIDRSLFYTRIMHKMQKIKEAVSESENKISKIIDWPLLGRPSSFESKGYLEWAFEILEYCAPYFLPEPLPKIVESIGFINQLRQYYNNTGEYREIFEALKKDNNFDISSDKILNSLGFARIRYQTESVSDEDNKKCPKNVFTDDEWQFLVWYQMLRAQSNSSSIYDLLFSNVFEKNENITIEVINFLNRFRINKEIITVNEGTPDEFIAYVKHLLHIFPKLRSDELINASNIRYQLESFLYIQSSLMDFFKDNLQQRESQAQNEHSHFEKKPIDLNSFLKNKEIKILHITQPDPLLGLNVVYDIYKDHGYGEDRYAFFSLERLLALQSDNLSNFLTNKTNNGNDTHSENPYLLVIECELDDEKICEGQDFLKRLFEWSENSHIKIILLSQKNSLSDLLVGETSTWIDNLKYKNKPLKLEFNDLTESSKDKLLSREVIFQGEEIALNDLITQQDGNIEIEKVINSEILVALIKNEKIEIGKSVPNLGEIEDYYIDRNFSHRIKIKQGVLSERSDDKFFVINIDKDRLLEFVGTEQVKSIAEIKRTPHQYRHTRFILADAAQIAKDDFKYLCSRDSDQVIHWLEKEANDDFLWHASKGSVSLLRKYLDQTTDSLISDKEIIKSSGSDNKLTIIAAEPGMGKSTVLTYLANQQKEKDPSQWVIRVDLLKHKDKIKQSSFEDINDILPFLYEINGTPNRLSETLLKHFITAKGNIVLLLDGFDEIEKNEQDKVIGLIGELKKSKIEKVLLSTRFHERERLENKLSAFSYTFEAFTEEKQATFLRKFWQIKLHITAEKETALKLYIKEVLTFFSGSINDEARAFMGIPLQIKMIAELFQSALKDALYHGKSFEPIKNFEILELYERFIQLKYNLYMQEKLGINSAILNAKQKESFISSFTKRHRSAAMSILVPDMDESMLASIGNKFLSILGEDELKELKLIGIFQVVNQNIDVTHRSFAEYFAAGFFNDMLQKEQDSKKYKSICSFLSTEMFEPKKQVIRVFLDYYLTKRTTIYEQSLDAIKFRLPKDPDVIPSEQLVRSLYTATFNKNRLSTLNESIGELLEKLKSQKINKKDVKDHVKRIKEDAWILSEIASHNKTIRYAAMEGKVDLVKQRLNNLEIDNKDVIHDTDNLGRTALHYAAQKGNEEIVEALLAKGFKVEALDNLGKNALHYAARYNAQDTETIACLLKHAPEELIKAIINTKDKQGFTPLYYAAQQGYWHAVTCLIDNGADADDVPDKKELLFHYIYKGDLKRIESILAEGIDINQYCDTQKNGLLHIAAQRGFIQIVDLLLEKGVNAQVRNKYDERPIHIAARNEYWEVVTRLLINNDKLNSAYFNDLDDTQKNSLLKYFTKHKSLTKLKFFFRDSHKSKYFDDFNLNAQEKIDLLCQFIHSGDLDIAAFFIDKGTEVDVPDSTDKKKPIQYAAECKHWSMVERLLIKQAALFDDLNSLGEKYVESLFNYSVKHAHLNIIKIFIERTNGQNYFNKLTDQQRRECLNHLIFVGTRDLEAKKAFIDTLIEKGVDINSQDADGKTLLHQAVHYQQLAIVRYLVEDKRADIHTKDDKGHTPLYHAAIKARGNGNVEIVKYLLEKEAGREQPCELHYAVKQGYKEVVEVLLTTGIGIDVRDNIGATPLHWAIHLGYMSTVESLVKKGANVNAEMKNKSTPLHLAAQSGYQAIVESLIRHGAGANVNAAAGEYEKTPLHLAVQGGYQAIVESLIKEGANVNAEMKNKCTPLHMAALGGYQAIVESLIKEGAEVNAEVEDKLTPLHLFAANGHLEAVKYLVEQGADIHAEDQYGKTPLDAAAEDLQNVNVEVVKYLLEKEARRELPYKLHYAAEQGYKKVFEVLLTEEGADVDAKNNQGETPLHLVAQKCHLETIKYLIEKRANIHAIDKNGHTPLYHAAINTRDGNVEVVKYLLEKEADRELPYKLHYASEQGYKEVVTVLLTEQGADVDAKNNQGETLLHLAARYGHQDVTEMLIEKGAMVDAKNYFKMIPLHLASLRGHKGIAIMLIKELIKKGKRAAIDAKNNQGETPLHLATENAHQAVVEMLIEEGATVDAKDNNMRTPLYPAVGHGYDAYVRSNMAVAHKAIVKILIGKGAKVGIQDKDKKTLLHLAASYGDEDIAKLLIEKGAVVDAQDKRKETPLHAAAANGREAVAALLIKELIKKGKRAAIDAKNNQGETPLHLAAEDGHENIARLLIEKGAVVDAQDNDKYTPLHKAASDGHFGMVKYLVEQGADPMSKGGENGSTTPLDKANFKLARENCFNDTSKNKSGEIRPQVASCQQIITLLRLTADNSHNDNSNNKFAGTSAGATFFNKDKKSDDEPQNQSYSAQQPHYSGG